MMNDSDSEIIQENTEENTDFGSVLALARKSKNYSIDKVCEQLKIPARIITAIENSDITALPVPTYTQGYIRAYAKFLEISEENILAIYNQTVPHDLVSELKPRSNLADETNSQSLLMKTVTLLLIAAGFAAVIYGSFQYYQKKADVMETELEAKERSFTGNSLDSPGENPLNIRQNARLTEDGELIVVQSDPFEKVETTETPEIDEAMIDESVIHEPMTNEPVINEPVINEPIADELRANNAETTAEAADNVLTLVSDEPASDETVSDESQEVAPPVDTLSVDVLKIYAEQGSWMQVDDANNTRLLYKTIPKGGSKVLQGQAPFRVSLGNAKTTKLVINDLVIDMSDYIRKNNTAKFTVSTKQQSVIFH